MNELRTIVLWLLVTVAPAVSSAAPEINEDTVAAFFDAAYAVQQQDHELVGVSVSVVYQGDVLFKRGYGFADLEARLPVDPDESLFRVASISKPFIWTALMQLSERGLVDLDAEG